jgi:hypothetical protein
MRSAAINELERIMKDVKRYPINYICTCRQVNQEAGAIWLRQVMFCFENPEDIRKSRRHAEQAVYATESDPWTDSWHLYQLDMQYGLERALELLQGYAWTRSSSSDRAKVTWPRTLSRIDCIWKWVERTCIRYA